MNIIESIMTHISIENIVMCMLTIIIVFLLYGYFNGLFRKETRQDFITKVKSNCKLLLNLPFTIKLILLLWIVLFIILAFAGIHGREIGVVQFLVSVPLLVIYLIVGNNKNIIVNIIITCFALLIVYIIFSIMFPTLISF